MSLGHEVKGTLKQTLEIAETIADPKIKLEAMKNSK